jgi:hypothetical protein
MVRRRIPRSAQVAASVALAGLLLYLVLRRVPLEQLGATLAQVKLEPLGAAVLLALASYTARAFRWGLILAPAGRARFGTLLGCTAAGFATSTVLPARLGELVRPLLLSSRAGLPAAATLASIVAERLLDLVTVVGVAAVALAGGGGASRELVRSLAWAAGSVAVLGAVLVLAVRFREALAARLAQGARGPVSQKLARFAQELLAALAFWGKPRHAALLGIWSLLTWGLAIAQVAVTAQAFSATLTPRQATLVLAISVVGLAVPTPGGVGGFHAAVQLALLTVAAWPPATATAYALVHHAVCFLPVSLVGFGYMLAVGASWRSLRQEDGPGR